MIKSNHAHVLLPHHLEPQTRPAFQQACMSHADEESCTGPFRPGPAQACDTAAIIISSQTTSSMCGRWKFCSTHAWQALRNIGMLWREKHACVESPVVTYAGMHAGQSAGQGLAQLAADAVCLHRTAGLLSQDWDDEHAHATMYSCRVCMLYVWPEQRMKIADSLNRKM